MNPDQIAHRICRLLDAGADDLPPHIQARLSQARGVALSRLAAAGQAHNGRRPRTGPGWSWAGLPVWARLGAASAPVLLAALLVLPNLGQDTDGTGRNTDDTLQSAARSPSPATDTPDDHPAPIVAPSPGEATVLVTADPAAPSDDPFEDEAPVIAYRHAFTPAPGLSLPVGTGSRFPNGHTGGFTRVSTGSPVSFTMPITPNPAPPLSSFDPNPSRGPGR